MYLTNTDNTSNAGNILEYCENGVMMSIYLPKYIILIHKNGLFLKNLRKN